MKQKTQNMIYRSGSVLLLTLAVLVLLPLVYAETEKPLKIFYDAPTFELINAEGKTFSSERLRGKIWVASFFFTSCQGPCPLTMANLSKVVHGFVTDSNVEFVSISVDPVKDSPERLREYAKPLRGSNEKWHFLTGDKEKITAMLKSGFRVGAGPKPDFHSTHFVLVDSQGRVRGYYGGLHAEDMTRLEAEIRSLENES